MKTELSNQENQKEENPSRILANERGVALLMALFTITMLMVIATEVMYQSNVEVLVSAQTINQVKAHYAAKAGVEISLLRIQIYQKALAAVGQSIPRSMLDPIWQMPFAWPPIVPDGTSMADKDQIKTAVKASSMQGTYFVTIDSEGSKIDVNDLGSPSKVVANAAREELLAIWKSKLESDDKWAARHRSDDFAKILDNIADWIDTDKEARGGGQESSLYTDRKSEFIPPNQSMKTIGELHMVAGMTDEIYDLLAPRLTTFGSKGINVNYASKEVLMSLTPEITEDRARQIIEGRSKQDPGPFKDEKAFLDFLQKIGVRNDPFHDDKGNVTVPLVFDSEINFRIHSTGKSGRVEKEITAIVYDYDQAKSRMKGLLMPANGSPTPTPTPIPQKDNPNPNSPATPATPTPSPSPSPTPIAPKNERPNIVYWNET